LWSDGDDYPEMVLDWYRSRGWHFVAISDHNILNQGPKWVHPALATDRVPQERLARYLERFGEDWVETDTTAGQTAVRLKTLDEVRQLLEEPGAFLIIQAEEITENFGSRPVHVNATNVAELILPQGGETLLDVFRRNIDAVLAQRERTGRPMFPHLNHPNFRGGITLEEFVAIENERFFEVYNGHQGVFNDGGPGKWSTEELWDAALSRRLETGGEPLYGLAVDDSHIFSVMSTAVPNPGRGWVQVRAPELTVEALIAALEAGDFYGSSGVELDAIEVDDGRLTVRIRNDPEAIFVTHFIGTRRGADGRPGKVGETLDVQAGLTPAYELAGDELYVRARVVSSELKVNGYRAGELEMAWTQPVMPDR
ncbi:MAG: histidinol-phosphatase, partial [Thermoanaerobaculia bacterium]|nr:histidinol-phosphatase [Thermoanaerobaculia bacterium]